MDVMAAAVGFATGFFLAALILAKRQVAGEYLLAIQDDGKIYLAKLALNAGLYKVYVYRNRYIVAPWTPFFTAATYRSLTVIPAVVTSYAHRFDIATPANVAAPTWLQLQCQGAVGEQCIRTLIEKLQQHDELSQTIGVFPGEISVAVYMSREALKTQLRSVVHTAMTFFADAAALAARIYAMPRPLLAVFRAAVRISQMPINLLLYGGIILLVFVVVLGMLFGGGGFNLFPTLPLPQPTAPANATIKP
ncbi:MAG: hypothetical protein QXT27_07495 [Pyrobaculum sp.]